jgi:hypothetical protein
MAGTIVTDRIESDASYASKVEIASPLVLSNTFAIPAGTVGAPALSPVGDTNTGIYFPAADAIGISTNGVDRVRVTSAGNVGIGTNTPLTSLDVVNLDTAIASGVKGLRVLSNINGVASTITLDHQRRTGDLATSAGIGPGITFRGFDGSNFQSMAGIFALSDGTVTNTSSPAAISFQTTPSGSTTSTERMRITGAGNVGIGTSSPNAKVDVRQPDAARALSTSGNANTQGTAQLHTIVRHYPVVSLGTKLIIPFVNQPNLASTTICRIMGHGARFNNAAPLGFTINFAVGHLSTLANLASWGGGGNFSSIAINGMNIEITFTTAYTSGTANGVYVTIEYMTNSISLSIDVANIAMN